MEYSNKQILVNSEAESLKLAHKIASNIKPGYVLAFEGDLGSGKSFFCRQIIKFLCGAQTKVTSPTFNLLQTYEHSDFIIYHYDLYRLEDFSEIYELGIEDALSNNVVLIEWPNIILSILPKNFIYIKIQIIGDTKRLVNIKQLHSL